MFKNLDNHSLNNAISRMATASLINITEDIIMGKDRCIFEFKLYNDRYYYLSKSYRKTLFTWFSAARTHRLGFDIRIGNKKFYRSGPNRCSLGGQVTKKVEQYTNFYTVTEPVTAYKIYIGSAHTDVFLYTKNENLLTDCCLSYP